MEIFLTIIDFLIFGLIIGTPILLFVVLKKIKYRAFFYFLIGLVVLCGLIWTFAWWTDKSNHILLEYYGCNFYGMGEIERYCNVLSENMERVKGIEISLMGIGWTLKAMFGIVIFSPYLLIVYIGGRLFEKIKMRKND